MQLNEEIRKTTKNNIKRYLEIASVIIVFAVAFCAVVLGTDGIERNEQKIIENQNQILL